MAPRQAVDQVARDSARQALALIEKEAALAVAARAATIEKIEESRREVREAHARLETSIKTVMERFEQTTSKVDVTQNRLNEKIETVSKANNAQFWTAAIGLIGALGTIAGALIWKIVFP